MGRHTTAAGPTVQDIDTFLNKDSRRKTSIRRTSKVRDIRIKRINEEFSDSFSSRDADSYASEGDDDDEIFMKDRRNDLRKKKTLYNKE